MEQELNLNDLAQRHLQDVISLDPQYPQAHFQLGYILKGESQFAGATIQMQDELKNDPNSAEADYGMGDIETMESHNDDAVPYYLHAIQLDPSMRAAWVNAADALNSSGQYEKSIALIRAGLKQFPEDSDLLITLEDNYLNLKQPAKTLAVSQEDLQNDTNGSSLAVTHENMAEAFLQQGNITSARQEWQIVTTLGNPEVAIRAGLFLKRNPA